MKGSFIIVAFFILGVQLAHWGLLPIEWVENDFSVYILYVLMFLVGVSLGYDTKSLKALKTLDVKIFLVPIATIIGSILGSFLVSFLLSERTLAECLAVGCGFGYYSLTSILVTEYLGAEMGTIALLANIFRELLCLLFAPLLVYWFGKLAPICAGGATSEDTTLPIITKFSGKEYVVIAIFHGFILDLAVPILVPFFSKL